ncbi:Gfo/Idh/MocA family protein [Enterococcus xiangfangensis]|uniref:Gfo/Idh/MocA family oxidoreductase n=1 Tax=Enterococcus xiangfangensis TaxID=1296537 RepID=A0ABU3F923_9ENTE|nr:Gfo/Idh/MocA family oxidoreductase [Enterococcus xiangfangensis]MDT2759161.1 Gfo/Idh/MocA family oxidoreductase [Enterococcus xiangfangensis]
MKLAIFGSGKIVQEFLPLIKDLPEIQVKAILGTKRSQEKTEKLQATYGIEAAYTDIDECLKSTDFDTVYVAVPNHLHYAFAKKALAAGKHVICEKPFTLKYAELLELERLALEKELALVEAITNQYLANYQGIKEASQNIGQLKIIECNYSQYSSRYDAFKAGTVLPAFDPKKGGGALMDINIYNIHLVVGLLGKPQRVQYFANVERAIDTSGMLILDYGDVKAVCIGAKDSAATIRSTIQGNEGSVVVNGPTNTLESYTIESLAGEQETFDNKRHPHRMYDEFKQFSQVIKNKDLTFVKQQLEHSKIVMEIVETALADAGIVLGEEK